MRVPQRKHFLLLVAQEAETMPQLSRFLMTHMLNVGRRRLIDCHAFFGIIHRYRVFLAPVVDNRIARYRIPVRKRRCIGQPERRKRCKHLDKDVLGQILGRRSVPYPCVDIPIDRRIICIEEILKRAVIAFLSALYQYAYVRRIITHRWKRLGFECVTIDPFPTPEPRDNAGALIVDVGFVGVRYCWLVDEAVTLSAFRSATIVFASARAVCKSCCAVLMSA